MADSQRIQSICNRFPVCEQSDERAFERGIDLLYRGEAGLKTLPLPVQLHGNARGTDLKKRTQNIIRRKQNVKKRFDNSLDMERDQHFPCFLDIDHYHLSQWKRPDSSNGI
jgi:hypothetical protein